MVVLFPLISGLLLFASFAPIAIWWLAPFSLLALLLFLADRPVSHRVFGLVLFGIAFYAPLLSWSNSYVGDIPWLLLVALQIIFLLPLAIIPFSASRPWLTILFPSFWLVCEWLTSHYPFGGFGWGRVAFSQADAPYASLAHIGGAPLLSFEVASLSAIFALVIHKQISWSAPLLVTFATSLILAAISTSLPTGSEARTFSVVAVQGGVPTLGLDFNARATAVFQMHKSATAKFMAKNTQVVDLIVWPENAVDVDPFEYTSVGNAIQSMVTQFKVPLIFGAVTHFGPNFHNESILWNPLGGVSTRYVKQHLTPFGEYIPLRRLAEFVSPYAKDVVDFAPGNRNVIHRVGNAAIAPIICFELIDDSLGRTKTLGTNLIVVETNSATFGGDAENRQQLGITRIRAIEHQRYVVSVSTTGGSAIVSPRGKLLRTIPNGEKVAFKSSVGLIAGRSISDRFGARIEIALITIPIFTWLIFIIMRKNRVRMKWRSK